MNTGTIAMTLSRGFFNRSASALPSRRAFSSFRIVAPTAILGYGFPESSFINAMQAPGGVDLIGVDAGSIDPGPYYLATRTSFTALEHDTRDLDVIIRHGFLQEDSRRPKLVIGSAGGCGTDNQVDILNGVVRQLLRDIGGQRVSEETPIATVKSEIHSPASFLAGRDLVPLGPWHEDGSGSGAAPNFDEEGLVVVAQMGLDPILCALEHADIVLCGRAYDPAVFAAEPIGRGFPAAPALHAAKALECGAIATVPGSGSDCLVADLELDGGASIWSPNEARRATPLSVAAHTLYEKGHPHLFGMPGGYLDTSETTFTSQQENTVRIMGTTMIRTPPTVKLEGAIVRGHRVVELALIDQATAAYEPSDGFIYGINGVEERPIDPSAEEEELGIVVSVKSKTPEFAKSHLALLRATLLHYGYEGRKSTAGNVAFPFSPSDLVVIGEKKDGMHEFVTVCGTRDPEFIRLHKHILEEVRVCAETISTSSNHVETEFILCGLKGQPKLHVREAVKTTGTMMAKTEGCDGCQGWVCDGGKAAEFTMQHLMQVDNQLLPDLFKIELLYDGDRVPRSITPSLRNWSEGYGMIVSPEEAMAKWNQSRKPPGDRAVGKKLDEMAHVIRSKNAGINEITFDLIFANEESYSQAKLSPALDSDAVQMLLKRRVIGVYCDDASLALKITCDRGINPGSVGDRDVYGAQQHRLLVNLSV